MKYRTIVVDPPWRYASAATKADAGKQYGTMSLADIAAIPMSSWRDDRCHLWLWATNALMEDAYGLVRTWGFMPLTIVTWCKPGPGVGHYLRNNTEHCILASYGAAQVPSDKPLSTWYEWPRRGHSQKPNAFYDIVETVSPEPRLDVFARAQRFGWDTWGNECFNFDSVGML